MHVCVLAAGFHSPPQTDQLHADTHKQDTTHACTCMHEQRGPPLDSISDVSMYLQVLPLMATVSALACATHTLWRLK